MEKNKVLIDSSCWIDFFRQVDLSLNHLMRELIIGDQACICGPVTFEIVGGCRTKEENHQIASLFQPLFYLELEKDDFEKAGYLRQKMKKHGFTLNGLDLLIAYLALKNHCFLLHRDRDFSFLAKHVPLKIFPQK